MVIWRLVVRLDSKSILKMLWAGAKCAGLRDERASPARFNHFTSGLEQALHAQREAHIARDAKLAAHESDLPVQFP